MHAATLLLYAIAWLHMYEVKDRSGRWSRSVAASPGSFSHAFHSHQNNPNWVLTSVLFPVIGNRKTTTRSSFYEENFGLFHTGLSPLAFPDSFFVVTARSWTVPMTS